MCFCYWYSLDWRTNGSPAMLTMFFLELKIEFWLLESAWLAPRVNMGYWTKPTTRYGPCCEKDIFFFFSVIAYCFINGDLPEPTALLGMSLNVELVI